MSIHRKSYWLNMKYKVNMLFFEVDISTNLKNCICYTIFSQTNDKKNLHVFKNIYLELPGTTCIFRNKSELQLYC